MRRQNNDIIEGEILPDDVPYALERVAPDIPTPQEVSDDPPRRERNFKLPNLLAWGEISPGLLLLALGLVAGGIFWTLINLEQVPSAYQALWPVPVLVLACVWALSALISRQAAAFLAATALIGVSLSFLLDAQDIANWRETLVGGVLITVGIGIVARGLLLRQGSVA